MSTSSRFYQAAFLYLEKGRTYYEKNNFMRSSAIIGRYSAVVDNKTWVALYWGYNVNDVADKASLDNVRQALNQIGMQISAEAPQIKKLLN